MIRLATLALLSVVCLMRPAAASEPVAGDFVLPGTFSEQTAVADLESRFGKANVRIVEPANGDEARHVVLFADDPTRRAFVEFHDAATLTGVRSISVRDAGSRWRGKHGARIGMSLAELRERNGKPFYFSGLDDEGAGVVQDQWSPALDDEDGTLGAFDVEEGDRMYFGVELGPRGPAGGLPADATPHDEASVSSDDPRYPRLGELIEVKGINATTSLDDEW